jgi:hypothetical protein
MFAQATKQSATIHQLPTVNRNTVSLAEGAISIAEITKQYDQIVQAMKHVMKDGEHYGTIPGCGIKKTLLKPGAEVLMTLFGLSNDVDEARYNMPDNHRECVCKVSIFAPSGRKLGTGVGSCSTMESKYRFRTGPIEITGKNVPRDYWDLRSSDPEKAQESLGGKGHVVKKGNDQKWYIAIQGEVIENNNPANEYNTVLKMSSKRALIDAVLKSTAASFLFTQDLEDMLENGVIVIPPDKTGKSDKNNGRQEPEDYVQGKHLGEQNPTDKQSESQSGTGDGGQLFEEPPPNSPEQIIIALARKNLSFSINDQTREIFVKLDFGETSNRQFVSGLGFKWDKTNKLWIFKP